MGAIHGVGRRVGLVALAAGLGIPAWASVSSAAGREGASTIASPAAVDFGTVRVGAGFALAPIVVTNTGSAALTIPASGLSVYGLDASDFLPVTGSTVTGTALPASAAGTPAATRPSASNVHAGTTTVVPTCFSTTGTPVPVAPAADCELPVVFLPSGFGGRSALLTITASDGSQATINLSGTGSGGYYIAGADGETAGYGDAPTGVTDARAKLAPAAIVGLASSIDGNGYWTAGADGSVYPSGDAAAAGSLAGVSLDKPVVGIASDPAPSVSISAVTATQTVPGGYWLAGADGGVFSFAAPYYGSEGGTVLNRPIVGISASPDGRGYRLVASDGGVFTFGDAGFFGSTGGLALVKPVVAVIATPTGLGYWLVASDGGVFAFGDAGFYGSLGGVSLDEPIVGAAATPTGRGYWLVGADGGVFAFGDAAFFGSLPGSGSTWTFADVRGIATTNQPLLTTLTTLTTLGATSAGGSPIRVLAGLAGLRGPERVLPLQR